MSFSLSGAIDLAADIIAHAPADGRIAKTAARLPSIQKEGGGRHGHSTNPVATKYQGTTKDGDSITLELSDDKATIDHVDFGNPLFVCDNPFWSIFPGDNSTKTKVQIWQSGGFRRRRWQLQLRRRWHGWSVRIDRRGRFRGERDNPRRDRPVGRRNAVSVGGCRRRAGGGHRLRIRDRLHRQRGRHERLTAFPRYSHHKPLPAERGP